MIRILVFVCLFTFCVSSMTIEVSADIVVYDNGAGGASGINSGFGSDDFFPQRAASEVNLLSDATLTGVEWVGSYSGGGQVPGTDNFTIAFHSDDGGSPLSGAPIDSFNVGNQVNRVDSGFDSSSGADVFEYSADVNFNLSAGTTYWLSIYDQDATNGGFFWGIVSGGGTLAATSDSGGSWFVIGGGGLLDFRLTAVPEPSSITVLGLLSLVVLNRRRRS